MSRPQARITALREVLRMARAARHSGLARYAMDQLRDAQSQRSSPTPRRRMSGNRR